jgi:oxalate decarboxylase
MFKADEFVDFSVNNWLRHLPAQLVSSHLNLGPELIAKIPAGKELVLAG